MAAPTVVPFAPVSANTSTISATTASAAVNFNTNGPSPRVRIYNAGPSTVFVEFGNSTVAAVVATSMPLPSGAVETFSCSKAGYIATICGSAGSATVYVTPGEGI